MLSFDDVVYYMYMAKESPLTEDEVMVVKVWAETNGLDEKKYAYEDHECIPLELCSAFFDARAFHIEHEFAAKVGCYIAQMKRPYKCSCGHTVPLNEMVIDRNTGKAYCSTSCWVEHQEVGDPYWMVLGDNPPDYEEDVFLDASRTIDDYIYEDGKSQVYEGNTLEIRVYQDGRLVDTMTDKYDAFWKWTNIQEVLDSEDEKYYASIIDQFGATLCPYRGEDHLFYRTDDASLFIFGIWV